MRLSKPNSLNLRVAFIAGVLLLLPVLLVLPSALQKTSAQGEAQSKKSENRSRSSADANRAGRELADLLDFYEAAPQRGQEIIKFNTQGAIMQSRPMTADRIEVAPPNDLCAGAEVIPAGGPFPYLTAVTADITDATTTGDPAIASCTFGGGPVSRSIWYSFTPGATGSYTISDCANAPTGTTVDDTVIGIYTSAGGCGGPFTELPTGGGTDGCDDDSCVTETFQSVLTTQLTGGTQYFIVVWQFGTTAPTAGNTAVQLRVIQNVPVANDTCASAVPLALRQSVSATFLGATNDYQLSGAACFTGIGQTPSTADGSDVVYSFTAPIAGNYSFKLTDFTGVGDLVLYTASTCPAATPPTPVTVATCQMAANRNAVQASEEALCQAMTAGQQTFIFVDGPSSSATTTFKIEVSQCQQETEPNDTPGTANPFVFGVEGTITPGAELDYYSLSTAVAGQRIFAVVDGSAGNGTDFDLRVTNTTDTLEYDNNNADFEFGNNAPVIGGTQTTGAATFLQVSSLGGLARQPYRLYAVIEPPSASAVPETEPNDTRATANSSPLGYFSGTIPIATDTDFYAFSASAGDIIFASYDGDPTRDNTPVDGILNLVDSAGASLITVNDGAFTSDNTPGAGNLLSTTPFSPSDGFVYRIQTSGTYYVQVNSDFGDTGDYLLAISRNGAAAVGPTAAPATISGRITNPDGSPLGGASVHLSGATSRITVTDGAGNYHFDNLDTDNFYTVTPGLANYTFSPASRSFSLTGNMTDAGFTANPDASQSANAIDTIEYFVRQQYLDFLGREPDQGGLEYWSSQFNVCNGDAACIRNKRIDVSAAFFASLEFQQTGSYIYGLYAGTLGRTPGYGEFMPDRAQVMGGSGLDPAKTAFAEAFVQRAEFTNRYPQSMTREQFVDAVIQTMQVRSGMFMTSYRDGFLSDYDTGGRALVVRHAAEADMFVDAEYNKAFVLMQYFGYLRRDIDPGGYAFWLDVLNRGAGSRGMVCAFLTSHEYQHRFSTVLTHNNSECGP